MTIEALTYILLGLISLIAGGDFLVRGSVDIAKLLKIPPLVIGLTVVAFGTSSPELAVSIRSVLSGNTGISVGNILGSNIYNILLVLGLAASLTPLTASKQLIRFDVPIMILASAMTLMLSLDGFITRIDGVALFLSLCGYTFWQLKKGRKEHRSKESKSTDYRPQKEKLSIWNPLGSFMLVLLGLGLLSLGSRGLVVGGVSIAKALGVSELIIGLTIIAVGTSLPEIVTSIMSIRRGHLDMAVGNVVGSNLFNLLGVLGLTGIIAPHGIAIPKTALEFDMLVMLAVAVACLPIFFTGRQISRWEGGLFLFYFVVYTAFLILDASGSQHLRTLTWVMSIFVIPMTVITLIMTTYRGARLKT
jgi:cation:H+ antiporter